MGILSGNPKEEPLHYGEVFGAWSFVATNKGLISLYQGFINHAGDGDLKKLLDEAVHDMKLENEKVEELLKTHGVGLPPALPERPDANAEDIPVGARFMDPEISMILSANVAQGLVAIAGMVGQCIREDVALMFGQFSVNKAQFGAKVLRLNKQKGWIIPPPLHLNSPNA